MITLRNHVASLVAVFLALAVGIALGGGPLSSTATSDDESTSSTSKSPAASDDSAAEYAEAFATASAARLYDDGLAGHAVALLAMPGAEAAQIKAINAQIVAAGGAITGTYTAGEALLDPDQKTEVDQVGAELTTQLGDPRVDPTSPTYDRMGEVMALAMATDQASSVRADAAAVTIREGLDDADFLTSPADVRNAPLILVVLPPGSDDEGAGVATQAILSGLVNGMASNASGVVVTGDKESADSGELGALRESVLAGPISTVDGLETVIGQVTTVLALMNVLTGTGGSYGASGSDGPVPLG